MNLSNDRSTVRYSILAVAIATLTSAVQAQELEEIMVTAERRSASVQDVPIAVSAYSEATIAKLQINETLDLVNVVPNLFGGNNTGLGTANMYYLRGQGNDESIATFDPPVGTYVDDVYVTRQNANNFSFYDVERIEVLRGPQGTLFGRNTTGGAINIILKKPGEEQGGYIEAGFGRFDGFLIRGSVDVPMTDKFLTKFSAYSDTSDGWLDNSVDGRTYNGKNNFGFRGAFQYLPNDDVTWDFSIDYSQGDEASVLGQLVGDDRVSTSVLTTGLPAGLGPQKSDYGNETTSLNITSNIGWGLGVGTANVIVGYRDLEQDFLLNFPGLGSDDFFWIDNDSEHEMISAEFKWNAELMDGALDFVTGAYYMDEDNTTDFADYLFGFITLADRVLGNTTKSLAIYAQGDLAVGENGTLTIGARFSDEEKEISLSDNTGTGALTTANLVAAGVPLKQSESNVTPRIAYAHTFSEDVMGYVSATNGFKSGGWNARGTAAAAFQPFGPETIWSYEAGVRAEWADGRVRSNVTIFQTNLEDLQTTSVTPTGAFLTANAGGLDVNGLELEMTVLPTDNLEVFLALGLQDAEYVDLPTGCTVPNTDFAAFDGNCVAAEPKRSPDVTATLSTTFNWPIAAWGATLRPTFSIRYIGDNAVGTRGLGVNGPEVVMNGVLALVDDNGGWTASLECKNCSDGQYITSNLFGPYWSEPMTWQAKFRLNFGGK